MAFVRDESNGAPQDTNANESDFLFVDPVIETLGVQPRLGAAGPQNLASPVHLTNGTGLSVQLWDSGGGAGDYPNLQRDQTPGAPETSTFGTLTFRRFLRNNLAVPITSMRLRIVDMTTAPASPGFADLRALSTGDFFGLTLDGPAQPAGGGLNSALAPNLLPIGGLPPGTAWGVMIQTGVQATGHFDFCIVTETIPPTGSAVTCMSGNSENVRPDFAFAPAATLTAPSGPTLVTLGTVSDPDQPAGTIVVQASAVPNGITVTDLTNTDGVVTAMLSTTCDAPDGQPYFVLTIRDADERSISVQRSVTVHNSASATLGNYPNLVLPADGSGQSIPDAPPSGGGSVSASASAGFAGTLAVDQTTGAVTVNNANNGAFTITVTLTNCFTTVTRTFAVTAGTGTLPAPTNLVATINWTTNRIDVTWNAVPGAAKYTLYRSVYGLGYATLVETAVNSYQDGDYYGNTTYLYKVSATDAANTEGPMSTLDLATTVVFDDDPAQAGVTQMKAVQIEQARLAVNAMLVAGSASEFFPNESLAGTAITPAYIQQLRTQLNNARLGIGLPPITFTNPATAGTLVRAQDLDEIRIPTQ